MLRGSLRGRVQSEAYVSHNEDCEGDERDYLSCPRKAGLRNPLLEYERFNDTTCDNSSESVKTRKI